MNGARAQIALAGGLDQVQPLLPEPLLLKLFVEQRQQGADPRLLTQTLEGVGHADEAHEVRVFERDDAEIGPQGHGSIGRQPDEKRAGNRRDPTDTVIGEEGRGREGELDRGAPVIGGARLVESRRRRVRQQQGGLTLIKLDPAAEVALNGRSVEQATLASGDEIRIANCRFVLQAPGLKPQKVLTEAAVRPRRRRLLPWLVAAGLLAAAAAAAWYAGLLDILQR